MDSLINFAGGAVYGGVSVAVGQPLDSIKTMMQSRTGFQKVSAVDALKSVWQAEGVRGLYRGGLPMFVGGSLFRSAQFGVYELALKTIRGVCDTPNGVPRYYGLDWQVVVSGAFGGLGRSIVESPFEFVKVRRQVHHKWTFSEIYKGSSATLVRNTFLFTFFMIYADSMREYLPIKLHPFFFGGISASLAWLTIWPLDVVKSRIQSGNYEGMKFSEVLKLSFKDGSFFKGLGPGLTRAMFANGVSMTVMTKVKEELTKRYI